MSTIAIITIAIITIAIITIAIITVAIITIATFTIAIITIAIITIAIAIITIASITMFRDWPPRPPLRAARHAAWRLAQWNGTGSLPPLRLSPLLFGISHSLPALPHSHSSPPPEHATDCRHPVSKDGAG